MYSKITFIQQTFRLTSFFNMFSSFYMTFLWFVFISLEREGISALTTHDKKISVQLSVEGWLKEREREKKEGEEGGRENEINWTTYMTLTVSPVLVYLLQVIWPIVRRSGHCGVGNNELYIWLCIYVLETTYICYICLWYLFIIDIIFVI